jgi:hypothetical protein
MLFESEEEWGQLFDAPSHPEESGGESETEDEET